MRVRDEVPGIDSSAKRHTYVEELFDLLRRKRPEKMRDLGIQRADTTPEFADLGMRMTKVIFDQILSIGGPRELMPNRRERSRRLGFVLFIAYNQSSLLPSVAFS